MDAFKENRAERALDWAASLLFAALVGYACLVVGGAKVAAMGAAAGFIVGGSLLAKVGVKPAHLPAFDVLPFDLPAEAEREPWDELLLDDPIAAPEKGSRVIALFGPVDSSPAALVARIEDYLGRDNDRPAQRRLTEEAARPDASAALHAALSNIRASLR